MMLFVAKCALVCGIDGFSCLLQSPSRSHQHLLTPQSFTWTNLLSEGVVEYLDPHEEETAMILMQHADLRNPRVLECVTHAFFVLRFFSSVFCD